MKTGLGAAIDAETMLGHAGDEAGRIAYENGFAPGHLLIHGRFAAFAVKACGIH